MESVYDIVNAGPRHRFLVRHPDHEPFMAHNCQYLVGATRLFITATVWGTPISMDTAKMVHSSYRKFAPNVVAWWKFAEQLMEYWSGMTSYIPHSKHIRVSSDRKTAYLAGCAAVKITRTGVTLPDGYNITYPSLRRDRQGFTYYNAAKRCRVHLHPGKVLENFSQALATQVINNSLDGIMTDPRLPASAQFAGQVHDELIFVCDTSDEFMLTLVIKEHLTTAPKWWPYIKLACDGGNGEVWLSEHNKRQRYGACK